MDDTITSITRHARVAATWFFVILVSALTLFQPMGAVYSLFDASPVMRAFATIALAVMVATAVTAVVWNRAWHAPRPVRDESEASTDSTEADGTTARPTTA